MKVKNNQKIMKKSKQKSLLKKKEKVLVVAQEIKFARLLSGNEKKHRDRVLKTMKKWLKNCFEKEYEFKEDDFVRIWKGLFYAVWMSDKPLVQEELCDNICEIIDDFPSKDVGPASLMVKAGLRMLATEWYGIDQHRIDKFLMLVRRLIRSWFRCLQRCDWSIESCEIHNRILCHDEGLFSSPPPQYARNALSLQLHIIDCYLEELAKVSEGAIPGDKVAELMRPIAWSMAHAHDSRLAVATRQAFNYLIRQSERGIEYEDKRRAWTQMGCPDGGPEALEEASDDEDDKAAEDESGDEERVALDPRAGGVGVRLRSLQVRGGAVAALLRSAAAAAALAPAARRALLRCRDKFEKFDGDEYPLAEKSVSISRSDPTLKLPSTKRAARKLKAMEARVVESSDELAVRGLSKKHKKRLLSRAKEILMNGGAIEEAAAATATTNGGWHVEEVDEKPKVKKMKKVSKDVSNDKENLTQNKTKKKKLKEDISKIVISNVKENLTHHNTEKKKLSEDISKKVTSNDKENLTQNNNKKGKLTEDISKKVTSNDKENSTQNNNKKGKLTEDISKKVTSNDKENSTQNNSKKRKLTEDGNNKCLNKKQKVDKKAIGNEDGQELKKSSKIKELQILKKNYQKSVNKHSPKNKQQSPKNDKDKANTSLDTPKKVKFVLKNNSMQAPVDYYKSIRQSPNIPFDSTKQPSKTNLKPNSTPSPINPFFKKKLRMKK